ncbi:DUF6887 family protein [Geminocystis sp. GBBB08]|uniref:DUF6887 family protein n=1 Tax=Geminocystis sp. GBBB08 TaxID=2604140 RepID=UPI0027E3A077|nr:hypothetical protein [Geminocystis sp. GBBB08]
MSLNELRKYILKNRKDEIAWKEFVSRPRPHAIIVTAETSLEEQERILQEASRKKHSSN